MTQANKRTWQNDSPRNALRASSGLVSAVRQIVSQLDGVREIRVLHRDDRVSKFFIILNTPSLEAIDRVVGAMVQIEETFLGGPGDRFDYDTVPAEKASLVPDDATTFSGDV